MHQIRFLLRCCCRERERERERGRVRAWTSAAAAESVDRLAANNAPRTGAARGCDWFSVGRALAVKPQPTAGERTYCMRGPAQRHVDARHVGTASRVLLRVLAHVRL
jgi:hypothetical protein